MGENSMAETAVLVTTRTPTLLLLASLLIASPSRAAEFPGKWEIRAPLPTVRSGIAGASLKGKIFVFGGESNLGTYNQTESYDPAKNSWQNWAPVLTARHGLGAAIVGDAIYVISGGPKPGARFSSVNEVFTPIK
jgi:N-acetylneuraminic acid mutarotase